MIGEKKETRIVFSQGDTTVEWHQPYNDSALEDIINGFYSCLIGATWGPEIVIDGFSRFAKDNALSPNYEDVENIEDDENISNSTTVYNVDEKDWHTSCTREWDGKSKLQSGK